MSVNSNRSNEQHEGTLIGFLGKTYYAYKRNNWMVDLARYFASYDDVQIDRPIFLLGTQGGGLTLVSRMLRRNERVVSVTGDHRYWAGADEMQNVLGPILAPRLTGITHKAPPDELFPTPRDWVYASQRLISAYRNTEQDVTPQSRLEFQRIVKWIIWRHSHRKKDVRFTDKSQIYTVKMSYIAGLLEGCDPKFLLITRNPYAICFSRVNGSPSLRRVEQQFTFEQRLELAAQHWANSMACALEDRAKVKNFMSLRFEDILSDPAQKLKEVCEFVELDFNQDMLPQPEHRLPFGSVRRERWYPIKPNVNDRYLRTMSREHVEIVAQWCKPLADCFGYEKPN